MIRTLLVVVLAVCTGVPSARAQQPDTITPDDGLHLPRIAQADRSHLLGSLEMYSLALYADPANHAVERLASADVPKALRIQIRYREDLRRTAAIDWRRELLPTLNPQATAHLRGTFAPLREGDVVLVEYVPSKGTTLRVNKAVAASGASHDLMLAFLDHWIGQRPVSEQIKQMLTRGSGQSLGAT